MIPVVSKGRALPLAWVVRRGKQGHCPEALPLALMEQGHEWIPPGARVVGVGDGACDGTALHHTLQEAGWSSVCRTGSTVTASWDGTPVRLETVGACRKPGTLVACPEASMTRDAYGPVRLRCGWAKGEQEPRDGVSHRDAAAAAWRLSATRCRIETLFSDLKSRGCPRHPSHRSDQARLSRLVLAAC